MGLLTIVVQTALWAGAGDVPPPEAGAGDVPLPELRAPERPRAEVPADAPPITHAPPASPWTARGAQTIDQLRAGLAPAQALLVEVSADWCAPCHQLADELLDTPAAAGIVGSDVGVRIDFESPEGQAFKRAYGVLTVPTLVVLDRAGHEVGRVEGYPGAAEWQDALRDARAGRGGLAPLEARVAKAPEDPEAQIALAQARLGQGDEARAFAALDAIIARSATAPEAAAHAARVKGRWLLRVREDAARGLAHFLAMMQRFAGRPGDWRQFAYWTALAHHAAHDDAAALAIFEAWARAAPTAEGPLEDQADFMVLQGFAVAQSEPVVRALVARQPGAASGHYLLARVLQQKADLAGARAAIAQAVALEADNAMYRNYQRRLLGPAAVPSGAP